MSLMRVTNGTAIKKTLITIFRAPPLRQALRFPQLTEADPEPVLVTDTKSRIYYVNPAWERQTGYAIDEVIGKDPRLLESGKTPKRVFRQLYKALRSGKSYTTDLVINKRKDGKEYQIYATYFPVRKEGRNLFYVQALHDVTKQKYLEKQRNEFFSVIAHELKTPITTMKLLAQMLRKRSKSGSKNYHEAEILNTELDRLTNIINDMLDVTRIETGKMKFAFEAVNISDLIYTVVENMQRIAEKRRIVISAPDNIRVHGDRYRLEQVLINLMTNAIKYSEDHSTIEISTKYMDSKLAISVTDQGKGIPKDKQKKIFDRFYQVNKLDSNKGLGLGLPICKEIIKHHKGRIWVVSKPGKSSTFFFTIPLVP